MGKIGDAAANIIGAGLDFANSALNRRSVSKQNEQDRAHAIAMYERQRADNLADWTRQNEYNSPEQQMERLRQAGLNPNLVYGKGADNTATAINKSNYQENKLQAPTMDFSFQNAISQYQQVNMQKVQTDNLIKQQELLQQDIAMRKAQEENERAKTTGQNLMNMKYGIENKLLDFDYGQKLKLADIQYDTAILDYNMKMQSMELNASRYELEKIKNSADVALAYANALESEQRKESNKILTAIAQGKAPYEIAAMKKDMQYKDAQIDNLRKTGKLLDGQTAEQAINKQIKELQLNLDKKYSEGDRKIERAKGINTTIQGVKSVLNPFSDTPLGDGLKITPGIGNLFKDKK